MATQTEEASGEHYLLEANTTEVERLTYQHEVVKDYMGSLVLAPLDLSQPNLHVLDSATADGLWLRDVATELAAPRHLTGTDIVSSYFPEQTEPDTTLLIHSITTPWPERMHSSFDLVHQRLALPGCGTFPIRQAVEMLVDLVKPGGWIQLIEADHSGPASEGLAMKDAYRLIKELFKSMGVEDAYAQSLKGWLVEAGLEDVHEKVLDVPLGKANAKEDMGTKATRSVVLATQGLVQVARGMPTSFTSEELDNIVPNMEHELHNVGGIHRLYCVWGRRPL
jgi:gliotoxin biosynthesis N-methyltransferase